MMAHRNCTSQPYPLRLISQHVGSAHRVWSRRCTRTLDADPQRGCATNR